MPTVENKLEISFSGDLCLNGVFRDKVMRGEEIFAADVAAYIKACDHFVCNFEGPLSENADIPVSSPPQGIEYLAQRGIDTFCLANNHIFDLGIKGFEATASAIDAMSVKRFGAGHSLEEASQVVFLEKHDLCVAIIGICHNEGMTAGSARAGVFAEKDFDLIGNRVTEAIGRANRIIVVFHGGEEYTRFPSPPKRELLKRIAAIPGVDAVVCHHSHTLQGMERFGDKLIFYSLGNFVFDLPAHRQYNYTSSSAILKFTITKDLMVFHYYPVVTDVVNGIISKREVPFDDEFSPLCDLTDYRDRWEQEAYRVLYNHADGQDESQKDTKALKNSSPLLWPFRASFYRKLFGLSGDKYRRSLYRGALNYRKKLKK